MENMNLGFLISSVIATTGLGAYVLYMNNDKGNVTEYVEDPEPNSDDESEHIKSSKKSVILKTKRRTNKSVGTRRRRY